jgi:crotonobetainyl-CoA:carnitine CoA-transferase CaiB-like acyl-CoA transferase
MGDVVLPTSPIRYHDSQEPNIILEPTIGEHTDQILKDWLGAKNDTIELLRDTGVVC